MIDRQSTTWQEVAEWAIAELLLANKRNSTPGLPPAETEHLRGRIAALGELLSMADNPAEGIVDTLQGYGFQGADEG